MNIDELRAVHRLPGKRGWARKQVVRTLARVVEWTTLLPGQALNVSRINHQLLVGGHVPIRGYRTLKELGVTHVIDMRSERCDDAAALAALQIELLHLQTPDRHAVTIAQLRKGVSWALPRLEQGAQLYCHCEHGVGRGPLMGLAILAAQGWNGRAAYQAMRKARWQCTLNDRQLEGLLGFIEAWPHRDDPPPPIAQRSE